MADVSLKRAIFGVVFVTIGVCLVSLVGCWLDEQGPTQPGSPLPPFTPGFGGAATFASPVRMAITSGGDLVVSDSRRRTIVAVDPTSLQPNQALGIEGTPLAVAVLNDRMFVGNVTRRTIDVFDAEGRRRGSFGPGAVEYPSDIAVDTREALLFVVDGGSKEVRVFDDQGGLRAKIAGLGTDPERLATPIGIAVDEDRKEVFVSDYGLDGGGASVKIFDYDGRLLGEISGEGSCGSLGCSGGFSRPQGIALDTRGHLYVADAVLAQILIYDRATGDLVGTLGGRTVGPSHLRLPTDVVIGTNGDVFVISNRTRSVRVFRPGTSGP